MQHQSVENTEDRGVGSNSQGQRGDGSKRIDRTLQQGAKSKADVRPHRQAPPRMITRIMTEGSKAAQQFCAGSRIFASFVAPLRIGSPRIRTPIYCSAVSSSYSRPLA